MFQVLLFIIKGSEQPNYSHDFKLYYAVCYNITINLLCTYDLKLNHPVCYTIT